MRGHNFYLYAVMHGQGVSLMLFILANGSHATIIASPLMCFEACLTQCECYARYGTAAPGCLNFDSARVCNYSNLI